MTFQIGLCIWTHKGFPWVEIAVYEGGGVWRNIFWTKRRVMIGPLVTAHDASFAAKDCSQQEPK